MSIEVSIDAQPRGGLSLIDFIPSLRPCRLEGLNGIGKSASIRLLTLLTGGQPYAGDEAGWTSFKANIGDAVVTIRGLTDAGEAVLRCTPDSWPDTPALVIGDDLGTLSLDGVARPASVLSDLLDVRHLSGTERLIETLYRRIETYGAALRTVNNRLDGLNDQRARLDAIADQLDFVSPARVREDSDLRANLENAHQGHVKQLEAADDRLAKLHKAAAFEAMTASSDLTERAKELSDTTQRVAEGRSAAASAEEMLEKAFSALEDGNKLQKAIAAEERKLTTLQRKRGKQLTQLSALTSRHKMADIDLTSDLNPAQLDVLRSIVDAAKDLFNKADLRLRQSRMTDAQRKVHTELAVVLEDGIRAGLADFVVLKIEGHGVTLAQLAAALRTPQVATTTTSEEVTAARRAWSELNEILEIHLGASQYVKDVGASQNALKKLKDQAPEQDELQAAVTKLREESELADEQVRSLVQRQGLLQASGAADAEIVAAAESARETLEAEGVDALGLTPLIASLSIDRAELIRAADSTTVQLAEVLERQSRRDIQRRTLALEVEGRDDLRWLTRPQGTLDTSHDEWWEDAAKRAKGFSELVSRLIEAVLGLGFAVANPSEESDYANAVDHLVESQALDDLADPAIAEALFDSGRPIGIDFRKQTITWETKSGRRREKPLSTFSSGQQALGFMRARLRQIADIDHPNRIVFLDEFGAFISADRRHPLAELLKGEDNALATQIVIVLPLQTDYKAQLAEISPGPLHDRYAARAAAIEAKGYFAEVFDE